MLAKCQQRVCDNVKRVKMVGLIERLIEGQSVGI